MEHIKSSFGSAIIVVFALAVIGLSLISIIGITLIRSISLEPGKSFDVISDTSHYSCIITEIDNDLVLNCLKAR